MSPESYESEAKEKIEYCLNCTLPEYMCHGVGNCQLTKQKYRRKKGQLEVEVLELVQKGYRGHTIARTLGVADNTVRATINRLKKKGIVSKQDVKNAYGINPNLENQE